MNIQRPHLCWHCDECGGRIEDGAGYVTVDDSAINEYREDRAKWEAEIAEPQRGVLSSADLDAMPLAPSWRAFHGRCDPRRTWNDYHIGIARVRTALDVVQWTAHLWEKGWFHDTNWSAFLYSHVLSQPGQAA